MRNEIEFIDELGTNTETTGHLSGGYEMLNKMTLANIQAQKLLQTMRLHNDSVRDSIGYSKGLVETIKFSKND